MKILFLIFLLECHPFFQTFYNLFKLLILQLRILCFLQIRLFFCIHLFELIANFYKPIIFTPQRFDFQNKRMVNFLLIFDLYHPFLLGFADLLLQPRVNSVQRLNQLGILFLHFLNIF